MFHRSGCGRLTNRPTLALNSWQGQGDDQQQPENCAHYFNSVDFASLLFHIFQIFHTQTLTDSPPLSGLAGQGCGKSDLVGQLDSDQQKAYL